MYVSFAPANQNTDCDHSIVKEKYGSDGEDVDDEEDSEEDETEDEDGEELTPAVDAAILRTLARIKRKDPSIYEQGKDVFEGSWYLRPLVWERCSVFIFSQRRKPGLGTRKSQSAPSRTK